MSLIKGLYYLAEDFFIIGLAIFMIIVTNRQIAVLPCQPHSLLSPCSLELNLSYAMTAESAID